MSVLVYSEIVNLYLDRLGANIASGIDLPIAAAEELRDINDAYAKVWEIAGGGIKKVAGATAWSVQPTADSGGVLLGILTDIGEVLHAWATTTSGSTGGVIGDKEMDRVDYAEILALRANGPGNYSSPKLYSMIKVAAAADANVQKMQMDVYPGVAARYVPIHYVPQFTPLDGVTITIPDVNDLESRDIALIAAARRAPLIGRAEFVPSILNDVSDRTAEALGRKLSAMLEGKQDK